MRSTLRFSGSATQLNKKARSWRVRYKRLLDMRSLSDPSFEPRNDVGSGERHSDADYGYDDLKAMRTLNETVNE
jgi:hypothetical protein